MSSNTCDCSKDSSSNIAACSSPICHRTRAQVAKRQQSQLLAVSSSSSGDPSDVYEIISATNTGSPNIEMDTTLIPSIASSEDSSLTPTCDSQPNFSIGECPLIVNDALIISVMLNEIVDITCTDPSAQHCVKRNSQSPQVTCQPLNVTTDDEICISDEIERFANEMIKSIIDEKLEVKTCVIVSPANLSIENSPIQFILNSSNENDPAGENCEIECRLEEIVHNLVISYEINESKVPDLVSAANVSTDEYNPSSETLQNVETVDPPENDFSENVSFLEIIDSEPDDEVSNHNNAEQISPSLPNFSLEIDFKSSRIPPIIKNENEMEDLESHVPRDLYPSQQSSGLPDSDEIGIVQFVTKNQSSLTICSLLPHERACRPTTSTVEVFSCEYCEKKFTSESMAHAHIFDLHIDMDLKMPSFQVQQSLTFVRNYPDPGCSSCSIGFLTLHLLSQHCLTVHSSDKFACAVCNSDFISLNDFYTHRCCDTSPPSKPFKCEVCEEAFESSQSRASHECVLPKAPTVVTSPDEIHSAVLLPLIVDPTDVADTSVPSKLPLFPCMFCEESFTTEDILAQHIAQIHLSFDLFPYSRKCQSNKKFFSFCKTMFASSASRLAHSCTNSQNEICSSMIQVPTDLEQEIQPVNISINQNSNSRSNTDDIVPTGNHSGVNLIPLSTSAVGLLSSNQDRPLTSTSALRSWKCTLTGCQIIKKSKKALSVHRFREHKIPFPKRNPPSSSRVSQVLQNSQTVQPPQAQDPVLPAIPISPAVQPSCPTLLCRSGDTLHLLFPIFNPTDCTEENCVFKSRGKTWHSIKCSLLRHLQTAHHLSNLITVHWCATCASRIKQPKKHQCLAPGVMVNIKIDGAFPCTENGCTDEFPSEFEFEFGFVAQEP
ncbi:hypothetical protein AVEN_28278-1 [Araneus ventricosus]|uniref:C2H2-type domain-containing protein n=1 Tax=Araneus ventricosus TaxID=182803 RepID=A0A4Y2T563_ARAVE|nr:hypothetical protein AVEN_28278-1 [Araneus ventricosus]